MFELSSKVRRMRKAGKDIISLDIGESDCDTPLHIKAAAIDAIHDGKTKYTPVDGIPKLKEAICQKLLQDNDIEYNPYQVIVSTGAKQSIHNALLTLVEEGDEVILPAPYWASYADNISFAGGTVVKIEAPIEQNFKITSKQLASAITSKTKVLFLNSPNNPSGSYYSKKELAALAKVLLKHPNIVIISDDIYEHILWTDEPFSNIINACPKLYDRTLIINGLSKCYAMTGWRIGYAAGPKELIDQMKKIQSQSTSCPSSITQYAALEALDASQRSVEQMTASFQTRHNRMFEFLQSITGCEVIPAQGSYYLFPNVSVLIEKLSLKDDVALADLLLEKSGVSVIPGSAFGMINHIRISFVISDEKMTEAFDRIKNLIQEYKSSDSEDK